MTFQFAKSLRTFMLRLRPLLAVNRNLLTPDQDGRLRWFKEGKQSVLS